VIYYYYYHHHHHHHHHHGNDRMEGEEEHEVKVEGKQSKGDI